MVILRRDDFLRPKKKKSTNDQEKFTVNKESSTKDSGVSGISGASVMTNAPDLPDLPESSTDNRYLLTSNNSQRDEKFITQEVIESKDRRKVTISVYDAGKEEKIEGDKVVRRTRLKFVMAYRDIIKECIEDCSKAVKEIAKATDYKVPKKAIKEKLAELIEEYTNAEDVPLVDYVRQRYADRLSEIEKDPFAWILSRTKEIVGNEFQYRLYYGRFTGAGLTYYI